VFSKVLFREVRGKGFFALEWTSFLSTNNTKKFNEEKFHELLLSRMSWGVRVVFSKGSFSCGSVDNDWSEGTPQFSICNSSFVLRN
jgi:hypothetical protein